MLQVENLTVKIENKYLLKNISFHLKENEILMVIGPNGSGKTTLIKAIMQNIKHTGNAYLNGKDIAEISTAERARQVGVLTQNHAPQFSFTVNEVVSLGRYAHQKGVFDKLSKTDEKKINEALTLTGTDHLKNRSILTLSGGELQRVFLAAVFAQDPKILILDEPTNHLDFKYQKEIFETLKEWVKGEGRAVISVVHDLNMVYTYGSRALLLRNGEIYSYGIVEEVLSRENLEDVYEVDVVEWMQNLLKYWS